jgi:hypothetical protein
MNKNKTFISMVHPDHPQEFLLLMCDGEDVTHWMAADGNWVALSEDNDLAGQMIAGLGGTGLLPKWDEEVDNG